MHQLTLDGERPTKRAKKAKKGLVFIPRHEDQYGLKICSVHAKSHDVETVSCRFCIAFGREVGPTTMVATGKTRAAVSTKKVWTKGQFRCDLYLKHLTTQHKNKWKEYEALGAIDRATFFTAVVVPFVSTLPASFEGERPLELVVSAPIVRVIVGDLLFHPEDVHRATDSRTRALAVFKPVGDTYKVTEKCPSRFRLAIRFMGRGASFRLLAGLLDDVVEETGIGRFRGCTEEVASRCARVLCAVSLQNLATVIPAAWAISIAVDSATHQGRSYADVRCRFSVNSRLHNFHLLAIPLHTRHTGENIFELVRRFLDALLPNWRYQVLGVSTDGAASMVGSVKGVVTRIESEVAVPLTRVWCGLHQLDLKMQSIFEQALNGTYLDKLYAVVGHLRRQFNLISEMQTTCPKVSDTRWMSMFSVVKWLCVNGFRVREYLNDSNASCNPNLVWWIFLHAMREVAKAANEVSVSLQGLSTLVQQQHDRFAGLLEKLRVMTGAVGPLSPDEVDAVDRATYELSGVYAISHANALAFTQDLGVWVCENLPTLPTAHRHTLVCAVARLCVVACSNIYALTQVPIESVPVTPKTLVQTNVPTFTSLLAKHRERIIPVVGEAGVFKIGQEFKELRDAYKNNAAFRKVLDSCDRRLATFDEQWALGNAAVLFPRLAYFCGGLATVFPNTATVESDFSLIGSEKTDKRTGLTDLSLEGILHAKQWKRLTEITDTASYT